MTSYYEQIANILRAHIVSDPDPQARQLPSGRELAEQHGVTRETIRRALTALADEGLIVLTAGRVAVTNPEGIRVWKQMRHNRPIVVIAGRGSLPEQPSTYTGQIYQGVLAASAEARYSCTFRQLGDMFPTIGSAGGPESPELILGVIMIDIRDERVVSMHVDAGYPVVCIDHSPSHPQADSVVVDCFVEAQQAVEYLVSLGHRELFYLGNTLGEGTRFEVEVDSLFMEAGYRRATFLAGLAASVGRIRHCFSQPHEIPPIIDWITSLQPRPTAGVIFDEQAARFLIQALAERGVRCPEDISIICKSYEARPPRIATVATNAEELGRTAVDLLLRRLTGRARAGTRVTLTSRLRRGPTVRSLPM